MKTVQNVMAGVGWLYQCKKCWLQIPPLLPLNPPDEELQAAGLLCNVSKGNGYETWGDRKTRDQITKLLNESDKLTATAE